MAKTNTDKQATQAFLPIAEIREGAVVLKDGTLRGVLLVSSINFALKSEEEQNAIIQGYVQFLNTFSFPLQIVIQSRRLDIDDYLERLARIEREQPNELLKMQTAEYRHFVAELIELAAIMSKRFYVVVPYSAVNPKAEQKKFVSRFQEVLSPAKTVKLARKKFELYRDELGKRMELVRGGLESVGLSAVSLDTQGLIELFYNTYNPETAVSQALADTRQIQVE